MSCGSQDCLDDPGEERMHANARAVFRELAEELWSAGYSYVSIAHGIREALQVQWEMVERELALDPPPINLSRH